MKEDTTDEKEEQQFKFIDDITETEIDSVLSSYELATNISLFPSIIGLGGGGLAVIGGAGIYGLAGLGSWLGLGSFTSAATFGITTGGIGLVFMGVGIGAVFLVNYFGYYSPWHKLNPYLLFLIMVFLYIFGYLLN